ncbi:MAG: glutamate--cysteine ligase, partial [Naasia sp.]
MSAELTLGAEEELHLIDLESLHLSGRAPQLLAKLPPEFYSAEIQRTTVETNTAVVRTLDELRAELLRLRHGLAEVAGSAGLGVAAVGTAPRSQFADFELTSTGRYGRMQEQYRVLVDEQLICGLQVHVGVSDRDAAVQILQRVSADLPALLALSSSSPFWNGADTGYSSIRTLVWQRWPSAGATGALASAAEYDALVDDLIASGVIADAKMAYFDVRLSSHAPTLELRICDACPLVDDAVLIAGLFRAAVRSAELDIESGTPHRPLAAPLHRAAMWQAARSGLAGSLLEGAEHPRPVAAPTAVRNLAARLRPQLEELDDWEQVSELLEATLARGNSADRQRSAFAEGGEIDDVVRLVVAETQGPAGGPEMVIPALRGYRARAGDEAIGLGSQPRPAYREVTRFFHDSPASSIATRQRERDAWTTRAGVAFRVDGQDRAFGVDLVPRIVTGHEWAELGAGLAQRARALEMFLRDVYGERRIVMDGVLSAELLASTPGWRDEASQLPGESVRAAVMGFDLVRNEFGRWRVLEDNLRNPSGLAYAMAARALLDDVMPDLPRPAGLRDPRSALAHLAGTLAAGAPAPRIALLTSGSDTSAWYEHRALADGAGLELVVADDLVADADGVRTRDGSRIGALYLRLDGELADLVTSSGHAVGRDVLDAARTGAVRLHNAPGNGL